jgi:hypothetical protein
MFAYTDILKHIATGGFWRDLERKQWVHAGPDISNYIAVHPEQRNLLGIPAARTSTPGEWLLYRVCSLLSHTCFQGMATIPAPSKALPVLWKTTRSSAFQPKPNHAILQASSVTALNEDKVSIEKYAIFRSSGLGQPPAEVRSYPFYCYFTSESHVRLDGNWTNHRNCCTGVGTSSCEPCHHPAFLFSA